jgi:ubiquitin carboxyl-terminal hydrolase 8
MCFGSEQAVQVKLTMEDVIYFQWDPGIIYKSHPLILEGGYEDWLLTYPMRTTNPQVKVPDHHSNSELEVLLGNLDKIKFEGKLLSYNQRTRKVTV